MVPNDGRLQTKAIQSTVNLEIHTRPSAGSSQSTDACFQNHQQETSAPNVGACY